MDHTTDTGSDTVVDRLCAFASGLATQAQQLGVDDDALRALATQASQELRDIGAPPTTTPLLVAADSLMDDLLSDYDTRRVATVANGGVVGVRTGLTHLDETLNGFQQGLLYMLAATPGAGKTTLALQLAATVAQAGQSALYISLENDATDLARKLACRLGQVSYSEALKGKLGRQEWAHAVNRLNVLGGRLFLSTPRASMPDLPTLIEAVMARSGSAPAVVVIDYLQAWVKRTGGAGEGADLRERIDRFTPHLRAIGEEYGTAILAISSQNRGGQAQGGMSALKESGDLEYTADVVMTLTRVDEKDTASDSTRDPRTTPLKLTIDKNRSGMTGRPIPLVLDGDYCTVEEEDR